MRLLMKRFADFKPLRLVCSDDYDDEYGGYFDDSTLYGSDDIAVPPPSSLGIFGATESNSQLAAIANPGALPVYVPSGAPPTSGTIIPASSPSGSGFNGMTLIQSLERDAAQVTNNAIIENANPYNDALITNVPISTGPQVVTAPKASHTALAIGLILLAGLGGYVALKRA